MGWDQLTGDLKTLADKKDRVALFIDFDNIRIGARQYFSTPSRNAEIHPEKLMQKASKYGSIVVAKAYADFTGHPKEFQDRLLFSAGIEPIHTPSKYSGGRRQSSADMHMAIDMMLEAIDGKNTDIFLLMTGDADFIRVVSTVKNHFGKKVIISGIQSPSTSLDLLNAGDGRDPISKQDCDLVGELGHLSRPLVTKADLVRAEAVKEELKKDLSALKKVNPGFLKNMFKKPSNTASIPEQKVVEIAIQQPIRRIRGDSLQSTSNKPTPLSIESKPKPSFSSNQRRRRHKKNWNKTKPGIDNTPTVNT